jgi:hypothetical protein
MRANNLRQHDAPGAVIKCPIGDGLFRLSLPEVLPLKAQNLAASGDLKYAPFMGLPPASRNCILREIPIHIFNKRPSIPLNMYLPDMGFAWAGLDFLVAPTQ